MKKGTYMNMIKQRIQTITFENLVKVKLTHSKVKNVEHTGINMQKYVQPNSEQISREEAQQSGARFKQDSRSRPF